MELELTTSLVDTFYKEDPKLAGEIRQRVAKWGATADDRARLRMTIESPEKEPEKPSEASPDMSEDMTLFNKLRAV
jgi:hypothetical protein